MEGFRQRADRPRPLTVPECLHLINAGEVNIPEVSATLERALKDVYRRIKAEPEVYVMSKDEYAVLNFYQERFNNDRLFEQAIYRFWKNFNGSEDPRTSSTIPAAAAEKAPYLAPPGYLGPSSKSKVFQKRLEGS